MPLSLPAAAIALVSALGGAGAAALLLRLRMSAEKRRAERWRHWESLLESLPLLACVKDRTGRYVYVNPPMRQWFLERGLSLYGWRDSEVMPPVVAAYIRENEARLLRGETDLVVHEVDQSEWLPGSGAGRWLLRKTCLRNTPWGDAILLLAQDVTDLHETQVELARQRDFVQAVLDSSDALIAVLDASGRLVRWNRKCDAATGYHESELRGNALIDLLVPPELRDEVRRDFARILAGEQVKNETLEIIACDGRRLVLELSGALVRDERGEPEWVVVTAMDRTAERAAEARRRELALELEAIWRNSLDAMAFVDRDGRIIDANPAFCRLTGWQEGQARGRHLTAAMAEWPGFEAAELERFRDRFRRRAIEPCSTREMRLADGRRRWLELACSWLNRPNGEPLLLLSARDITDRVRGEQELRAANEFLEATALWARELALKAESASAAKTAFLAHVSHELRTPMNAVLGMLDLALGTRLDPQQREYLETARESAESLLGLVDDLLDVARAETGRLGISPEPVELRDTLNRVMRLLIHRGTARGLDVRWRVADDVPDRIIADPARLRQVIANLAGNALKFTRSGSVEVSADLIQACRGPRIRFLVSDTGPGIPPERWSEVFQPFMRLGGEVDAPAGTGLGLTIAASLVEAMGGWLLLGSQPGAGTQFCFTLPLQEAAAQDASAEAAPARTAGPQPGGKILVAEDNAVNQRVIAGLLEREGFQVTLVSDGESAVREALSGRHDLVLMDVQMPGLDGWAAARAIREAEAGRQRIPIIAMTARALEEDGEAAREAGMDAYLAKPVRMGELLQVLRRFLPGIAPQPAAEIAHAPLRELDVNYIDVKGALDRLGGDSALLAELAGLFLEEGPRLLSELDDALRQGDAHAAQNAAHQLKGLLAQFCAERQRVAAWEVELAARQADLVAAREKAALLRQALDSLRPELQRLAQGGAETA
ncbi:MAG: PAS domain S-box protein [Bryobacteraceae bacterium]|nr:PAS domain S-box protein [Bryobacteraceae bacterium]